MIQFTRQPITGGLEIKGKHIVPTSEAFMLTYSDSSFTIGTEPYSLTICPHYEANEPWRIEGLRIMGEDTDINEIWFTGTMAACITEFERITQEIRDAGHQIDEPENYDLAKEVREHQYHKHILPIPPWNLGE